MRYESTGRDRRRDDPVYYIWLLVKLKPCVAGAELPRATPFLPDPTCAA